MSDCLFQRKPDAVFSEKSQALHTNELGKTFNVMEGINLSKLESGNYEVILSAGDREYSFRVDKE